MLGYQTSTADTPNSAPKPGDNSQVGAKTGDSAPLFFWLTLLVLAVGEVAITVKMRKNKKWMGMLSTTILQPLTVAAEQTIEPLDTVNVGSVQTATATLPLSVDGEAVAVNVKMTYQLTEDTFPGEYLSVLF